EQHAVTAAAGMAMSGLRPVVAVYSTFLSRAWDQVVYDVALHKLPVVFCLDRAGITGDDGPSHHGVYDMTLLCKVPGMRVLAPSSAQELQQMLHDAMTLANDGPVAIRYPKGTARNVDDSNVGAGLAARRLVSQSATGAKVAVLAIGKLVGNALKAVESIGTDANVDVWDVRSCQPLDPAMISAAAAADVVITVEDGIVEGGVGAAITQHIEAHIATAGGAMPRVHTMGVPTRFIAQAKPDAILAELGLDATGIADAIRAAAAR
ncbi:MAG: transketolase C-terminal domain-containing protein, partial [Actinomycetota bacterium]